MRLSEAVVSQLVSRWERFGLAENLTRERERTREGEMPK